MGSWRKSEKESRFWSKLCAITAAELVDFVGNLCMATPYSGRFFESNTKH